MKEFVENLLPLERNLFFMLNGSDFAVLDSLMYNISITKIWFPLYLLVLFVVCWKTPVKQSILVALGFVLMVVLCDQLSASVARPFFERFRPGHHPDFQAMVKLVNGERGGLYGFFSSHATNCFGLATLLWLVFRHRWVTLVAFLWATAIAWSRIYLGKHFVTDVFAGMIVGMLISLALYYFVIVPIQRKLFEIKKSEKILFYSEKNGKILGIGFSAYFVAVVIYSVIFTL